jgi:hypothetical protein
LGCRDFDDVDPASDNDEMNISTIKTSPISSKTAMTYPFVYQNDRLLFWDIQKQQQQSGKV